MQPDPAQNITKARRNKNLAMAVALLALVAIIYAISVMRMSAPAA